MICHWLSFYASKSCTVQVSTDVRCIFGLTMDLSYRHLQERALPRPSQSPTAPRTEHIVRYSACIWRGHEPTCRINRGYLRAHPHVPQGTTRACLDAISLQCLLELVCPAERETRG